MSSVASSGAQRVSGGIDSGPSTTRSRGSKSDNRRDYNYVRPSQEPTEKAQKPCSEQSGNEHGHGDTELHRTTSSELRNAVIQTILSSWKTVVIMVSLIFGGCCANVFTLETIIKDRPRAGPLITFAQFLLTALFTFPSFISFSAGPRALFFKKNIIPLSSWFAYTAFFVTINMLNNWAFAYKISVPLHIILRSGGPVASMIVGRLFSSRKYSQGQIVGVAMLTLGVAMAALADAQSKGQITNTDQKDDSSFARAVTGFSILVLAMVLSSFQGIYADKLYATYGREHWKEALFYSHTLSLPLFLGAYSNLSTEWNSLFLSPPLLSRNAELGLSGVLFSDATTKTCAQPVRSYLNHAALRLFEVLRNNDSIQSILVSTPAQVIFLILNALTQYLCIRGVHLLSAKSSSLTVTIVLNIRKLVSLLLSIYLFGNDLTSGVSFGAIFVFVGGALYGLAGTRPRKALKKE
ncbi:putative UPD-GlcNAc transporter (Mnn2-2) [Aspergillus candidus]|uniref:UAA-domain-containing protein n=1 Tax=Aspergillus candidus TaxID=41067 RepID=A0A2I2F7X3_ASPCN|nr:UAA-domain-containing protein [Aspergillus candidus]PLB36723.1 UAA-domain-containing protein [Aspergillus candidus]